MALDNDTREFISKMAASGRKAIYELTPQDARANGRILRQMYGAGPDMHEARDVRIEGADGGTFEARLLVPNPQPDAVLVYYHGGGWVVGHIDEFDTFARELAYASNSAVVLVNYRKAPEHPFPVAVDDAWSALLWTDRELEAIAGRRVPLVVGGDSAGGNLAAVVSIRSRDRSGPKISLQVLAYPVTDGDLDTASYTNPENQLMLNRRAMEWFWNHYVPAPEDRTNPEASPLRNPNLENLPPAVILTAEHDVLKDECEAYARALLEAGNQVRVERFDGQMHGFLTMVNVLPGSASALNHIAQTIKSLATEVPTA